MVLRREYLPSDRCGASKGDVVSADPAMGQLSTISSDESRRGKPTKFRSLTADVARQWDQPIDPSTVADFPEEHRAQMLHAIRRSEAGYGMAEIQRGRIAVSLIQKYVDGEGEPTFRRLKRLRNKRLAHREIEARTAASAGAESATERKSRCFIRICLS